MASIDVAIGGGSRPFSYSIKKIGDNTERFQGRVNDTLFFSHGNTGTEYYELKVVDTAGCEAVYSFSMNCSSEVLRPSWLTVSQEGGVCDSNGNRSSWNVVLGGIKNSIRYKICYDATYSCGGDCTVPDGVIDASANTAYIPVLLTSFARKATIRVYSDSTCTYYTDVTVDLPAQFGDCCTSYAPTIHYDTLKCIGGDLAEVRVTNRRIGDTVAVRMYGTGMDRFISTVGDKVTFSISPSQVGALYTLDFASDNCTFGKYVVPNCATPPACPEKTNSSNTWIGLYGQGATSAFASKASTQTAICNGSGVSRSLFIENGFSYKVNDRVWISNDTTTCSDFAPDGYYYIPDSTGIGIVDENNPLPPSSSSKAKIVHIVLGKIASVEDYICADPNCDNSNIDVVFLIDESASITDENWTLLKSGVNLMIDKMSNGLQAGNIRLGIVAFGSQSPFYPNTICSRVISQPISVPSLLKTAIDNLVQGKGQTPLTTGLRNAYNLNFTRSVPRKIVVITDGEPNVLANCVSTNVTIAKPEAEAEAATIKANGFGITTVAINVDTVASDWLRTKIASSTLDHYRVSSFAEFGAVANSITENIC